MTTPEVRRVAHGGGRAEHVQQLLAAREHGELTAFLSELHPSDLADLMAELEDAQRLALFGLLPADLASETLAEMGAEEHPEELLVAFGPDRIGELVSELSDDDAVDLIGELPPAEQTRVLGALPRVEAGVLKKLLQYPEESAGGIMTSELVAVSVHLTAGEAIAEVRRQAREIGGDFYAIFVIDLFGRLLGTASLRDVVVADPARPIRELVRPPAATVAVETDQEEVARIIARYNLPSIAVVGPRRVLVGRVTWDDVMDVLEAEQTEDILRLGGVVSEEEVRGDWIDAVRGRLPWLLLNLLTAALAASVVAVFLESIERAIVLAVIMPVIAGMGGNAGTQALAVTVRRLALEGESAARGWGIAFKELRVGLVNGAVLGCVVGLVSYVWQGDGTLGLIVLLAMWGNLVVASVAGAFVPILLARLGIDPAVASSVFVTTLTDLGGFLLLLGLASVLLL